ncbi:MAG: glycosyltransferase family 4 protein [Candidatus Sumerlaeia bacterium]|nr:glycosyltransferase family 4 protein [Candidatus Sumerlaeia bacterium]
MANPEDPRVLHIDTESGWRGGQQQVFWLTEGLARRGVPQRIACPEGSPLAERLADAGVAVARLKHRRAWDPRAVFALRREAEQFGASIVHAHAGNAHSLAVAAFRGRLPVVTTRRVDFRIQSNLFSRRKYTTPGQTFIAISTAIARILEEGGVPPERIRLVPSGIDSARVAGGDRAKLRAEFLGGRSGPLVGYIGAFADHKDLPTLLRAVPFAVAADLGGLRVALVGSGPGEHLLRSQAAALPQPDRIHFAGWREDVADCLAAFDLFCVSSKEEGLCTSLLDAQAAGVPCAITAAGGMIDIVQDGVNGLVSPVGDAAALAASWVRLAGDPALAARCAEAGRRVVADRFTKDAMVEGNLAVYRETLAAARR